MAAVHQSPRCAGLNEIPLLRRGMKAGRFGLHEIHALTGMDEILPRFAWQDERHINPAPAWK